MPQNERKSTEVLSISLPKRLTRNLKDYAAERDESVSKVAKDAVKYYLWLNRWREVQEGFAPAFKKLGIKTDDDVEKYFG